MGKKGKKGKDGSGKKSGKKKGGKKGKKAGEPQMTWKEALLAYQINIKEKQMEDVRYELRALEEKNLRHKERNERLREEQHVHIKNMLKQAEEIEKKLAEEEVVDKDQVIATMMENWQAEREENKNVADLKEQIARKEAEIVIEQKQVEYWKQYQVKGQLDHSMQIKLLEHELIDMQSTFDEMASHLERTWDQAKTEITVKTDETLEKQKFIATEKAMSKMDKYSRQEVMDNDWLEAEVEIHRKEVNQLLVEVEQLEKDNLSMMSELFECQVDDLKISRNFFLTQFSDGENLDETGILEMDLAKLDMESYRNAEKPVTNRPSRPKSAVHQAVTDKILAIEDKLASTEEEEEEDIASEFDGIKETNSDDEDPFNNYFQFDDEDFDDYLKLGPLELKLLSISGQQMTVHKQAAPSQDMALAQDFKPDKWPVTGPMLHDTIKAGGKK